VQNIKNKNDGGVHLSHGCIDELCIMIIYVAEHEYIIKRNSISNLTFLADIFHSKTGQEKAKEITTKTPLRINMENEV
jgi:hypothetical protein